RARRRGFRVAWGSAWEEGGAPAFWPWVQVIRGCVQSDDPRIVGPIADFVPELRPRAPGVEAGADPSSSPGPDAERERFQLFDTVTTVLKSAAERQPLVLVFDDLHAAASPALLLLLFLSRELRDARILVIGTYRDGEAARIPPVARALARIGRHAERLELSGLGEQEVASLIEQTTRRRPAAALATAIHVATDGNPFFVDAILRVLDSGGALPDGDAPGALRLPREVYETVRQRFEPFSEDVRRVLTVAAVIGREFDLAQLEPTCDLDRDRLQELLREALAAGVIRETTRTPARYAFVHGLLRETLYDDLPAGMRRALHRSVGEALEGLYADDLDAHAAELARHFLHAATCETVEPGVVRKAIDHLRRAGERAQALLAFEEAALHYEQALSLLKPSADPREVASVLLALATAQGRAGDMSRARETFQLAASHARAARDTELLARAALGFGATADIDGFEAVGHVDTDHVALLEEALAVQPPDALSTRARLLGRLSLALYWSDADQRREALGRDAMDLAERTGDPAILAATLSSLCFATWRPDNLEERLATATRLLGAAGEAR
ncbi:MAG: ATP-binding protein, partial [Candidatus Binatia bacterium]